MSVYSLALGAGLLVSAPWWMWRMLTTSRYRAGLPERLGRVPGRVRAAATGRKVVWVHAVSVGEVLAVAPLVAALEAALLAEADGWRVVVSTTTRTGQALARERFGAERVFSFPLDFAWAVRAWMRALQPHMVVLVESELWPRLLHECARARVPVAVVNARMSDRSFRRAQRLRRPWGRVLRQVTLFLAQSGETAERLRALGVSADAVCVTGNLKFDVRAPRESRVAELIRAAAGGRQVLVAGSTVGGLAESSLSEDDVVLEAWERAMRQDAQALMVLAPRHPERFDAVYAAAMAFPALRASEMLAQQGQDGAFDVDARVGRRRPVEVVVLDTIGDLAAVYGVADVAFVGGSLVPRGGHNPLEPARFAVPVVMGPSFENFREIVDAMRAAEGITIVRNADELASAFRRLLKDGPAAAEQGQRGMQVFAGEQGATGRTVDALLEATQRPPGPARAMHPQQVGGAEGGR